MPGMLSGCPRVGYDVLRGVDVHQGARNQGAGIGDHERHALVVNLGLG